MNGEDVPLRDNGDGTYTITGEYVAGPITVRIDREARGYHRDGICEAQGQVLGLARARAVPTD